jgi:two-component system, cell cycle response regulator CpdR
MIDEIELWLAGQRGRRARTPARGSKMDGLSILVVDADPRYRTLVSRRLEVDGHQTTDASDGRSAREALRGGTWQLLWLHSSLPDVSWEEIAREAREQLPDCFITVLSDSAESPHRPEASCVDAVLPHPWKETELKEVLAGAAAGRSG